MCALSTMGMHQSQAPGQCCRPHREVTCSIRHVCDPAPVPVNVIVPAGCRRTADVPATLLMHCTSTCRMPLCAHPVLPVHTPYTAYVLYLLLVLPLPGVSVLPLYCPSTCWTPSYCSSAVDVAAMAASATKPMTRRMLSRRQLDASHAAAWSEIAWESRDV
jgi:hypothetical protein